MSRSTQSAVSCQMRAGVFAEQLRIVVEHFLEMRNHPGAIDGIACEAAPELVVKTALRHSRQRQAPHVQRLEVRTGVARAAVPMAHAELDAVRMRKFRCARKTAEIGVKGLLQQGARLGKRGFVEGNAESGLRNELRERRLELRILRGDLRLLLSVILGHTAQQIAECRHPVAGLLGKIRAAEKWLLLLGSEKQ